MFPKVDGDTIVDAHIKSRLSLFAYISWAVCAALAMRVAYRWGKGVGASAAVSQRESGELQLSAITAEFFVGLVETIPMMLFIFVLFLLGSHFHGMTKKGLLTTSFASAIEAAAGILMVSSVWTMIIAPTTRESAEAGVFQFMWNVTDFSLGVIGVGAALIGLSIVMKEAVKMKAELDSYI